MIAATGSRAVEIADGVGDQTGFGEVPSLRLLLKLCSNLLLPGSTLRASTQTDDDFLVIYAPGGATLGRRTIEVSDSIEDQATDRIPAILPVVVEIMQYLPLRSGRPSTRHEHGHTEDRNLGRSESDGISVVVHEVILTEGKRPTSQYRDQ
jgi:hypothetical protein